VCLVGFTPSFLRAISTGFTLLFSYMDTKYTHHIHPHPPFSYAYPSPTGKHPWKRFTGQLKEIKIIWQIRTSDLDL
jgi:hypothetical protein